MGDFLYPLPLCPYSNKTTIGVKKLGVLIAIVVVSLGGLLLLSPLVRNAVVLENGALALVPNDALIVARVNSWNGLLAQQREADTLWSLLRYSEVGKLLRQVAEAIDSLRVDDPEVAATIAPGESCFSWHAMGKQGLSPLGIIASTHRKLKTEDIVSALFPRAVPVATQVYSGTKILSFTLDERKKEVELYAASKDNLALFSSSRILLEQALRLHGAEHNLLHEPDFAKTLQSASRNVPWNAFLQLPRYAVYVAPMLGGIWQRLMRENASWTSWLAVDIAHDGAAVTTQGLSLLEEQSKIRSQVYTEAKSVAVSVAGVAPETTTFFLRWGDRDPSRLYTQLAHRQATTPSLLEKAEVQEVSLVWDEYQGTGNWLLFLTPRSASHALGTLRSELSPRNASGVAAREALQRLQLEGEQELVICPSGAPDYFQRHFGLPFSGDVGRYYGVIDRHIVFASSPQLIERAALSQLRGATLEGTSQWREVRERLQSQCNFMFYIAPRVRRDFAGLFFTPASGVQKGRGAKLANSLAGCALQVSGAGKILFYNGVFQVSPWGRAHTQPSGAWRAKLEGHVVGRPLVVVNHNTKENEVLVQDDRDILYLINPQGRILWHTQLDGSILGEPKQVDLLRNGKLQYVFVTRNKLHAVDRKGNHVAGFPVRLPAETYAPLAVFDYEGQRDYRFFVSCGRKVYVYDRGGKRVEGFHPPVLESAPVHPWVWFASHGKDYIVGSDAHRLYFLNRRGEERFRPQQSIARAAGAALEVETGNSPRVVTVSDEGELCVVSVPSGEVRRVALPSWRKNSAARFFDLNRDGVLEVIYTSGKELVVAGQLGNVLGRVTLEGELVPWLQFFHFGTQQVSVGVASASARQVWLVPLLTPEGSALRGGGTLAVGEPIEATTPLSIGRLRRDGPLEWIVGSGDEVRGGVRQ